MFLGCLLVVQISFGSFACFGVARNVRQANVPMFEAPNLSRGIVHNVWLVAGGQLKTFVLSHVIKINKELRTSRTHSPARLPQAFVVGSWNSCSL
jgi:hypothetical protein